MVGDEIFLWNLKCQLEKICPLKFSLKAPTDDLFRYLRRQEWKNDSKKKEESRGKIERMLSTGKEKENVAETKKSCLDI